MIESTNAFILGATLATAFCFILKIILDNRYKKELHDHEQLLDMFNLQISSKDMISRKALLRKINKDMTYQEIVDAINNQETVTNNIADFIYKI